MSEPVEPAVVCGSCGAPLADGAATCGRCGTDTGSVTGGSGLAATIPATPSPPAWDGPFDVVTSAATLDPDGWVTGPLTIAAHAAGPRAQPVQVGERFGTRYHVMRLLGVGGMGAVYQAWDNDLGMAVALKVIQPPDGHVTRELQRQLKNELVLARQVTHKNVIRIHDLGDVGGIKYISMPFVEGADLRSLLQARGELPMAEALGLMRQIAAGLSAAHDVGVVHRDLKPANILVQRGQAIIMDFGIAHSLSGPSSGVIAGTPMYMAPEQARGRPVDHRADIYAFGLILFEVLAGRRWNQGIDPRAILSGDPAAGAFREYTPQEVWPSGINRVLSRCLALDPNKRYESASALATALESLDESGNTRRQTASSHPPVAVLICDIDNQIGEPRLDGVVESTLAHALEEASFISIYPGREARGIAAQIAPGRPFDGELARIVAQREGINALVHGRISAEGSGYRITLELMDPIPGKVRSTQSTIALGLDDLLRALAFVGGALREELGDSRSESEEVSERETFTSSSLEAASAYSAGQEHVNNGRYADAIPLFERATTLDPEFGRAYCSWAVAAYALGQREETERLYTQAFSRVERMTERERLRMYGTYYLTVGQAYQEAVETYTRLVEQYPADRAAHGNLAVAYFYLLNFAKAFDAGRRALALYPHSAKLRNNVALYAMYSGDFDTAAEEGQRVLERDPTYARAFVPLAVAAVMKGGTAAAPFYERMAAASPAYRGRAALGLADLAMYGGRYDDVLRTLPPAIKADLAAHDLTAAAAKTLLLAEAHLALGKPRSAITSARHALAASRADTVLFSAARIMARAGRPTLALDLARELGRRTESYSRAYANSVRAEVALHRGEPGDAVDALRLGQQSANLWLINFLLGVAYVEAQRYPEALAALDTATRRRGEATCLFLDDVPTLRYLAPLVYWQARAQEGLGLTSQALHAYRQFLGPRAAAGDQLVVDAEARIAGLRGG